MKVYKKIRNSVLVLVCLAIFVIGFINVNITCTRKEEGYYKFLNKKTKENSSYEKIFNKWVDNAPIKVYADGDVFMKIYLKNYNLVVYRDTFDQIKENFGRNIDSLKSSFKGKLK